MLATLDVSIFYYSSKLKVLNLTFFYLHSKKGKSYLCDEFNAKRGANEIGSCVLNYITNITQEKPNADIIFWTDNCAGQQKNQFMIALYMYVAQTLPIDSITHKFLVKGYTQNETAVWRLCGTDVSPFMDTADVLILSLGQE